MERGSRRSLRAHEDFLVASRTMPGLPELRSGDARIQSAYRSLPDGAEMRFKSDDLRLITALHRWFRSQFSEHGADAQGRWTGSKPPSIGRPTALVSLAKVSRTYERRSFADCAWS